MQKKIDLDYIRKLIDETSKLSSVTYEDLPNYNLFLSQVIDLLNDKFVDERFTDNIIQNYIKNEVITKTKLGKKRGYTKTHLIQLILLGYMRPILSTEEIKKVFKLAFNEINDTNDDILSWEETYKIFIQNQKESFNQHLIPTLTNEVKIDEMVKKCNLKDKDEEQIRIFLLVLSLISEASAIKSLVEKIVNKEYELKQEVGNIR